MSTPERQQDPGEHGYGGVGQEKDPGADERAAETSRPAGQEGSGEGVPPDESPPEDVQAG